jgi:hypothetical protein
MTTTFTPGSNFASHSSRLAHPAVRADVDDERVAGGQLRGLLREPVLQCRIRERFLHPFGTRWAEVGRVEPCVRQRFAHVRAVLGEVPGSDLARQHAIDDDRVSPSRRAVAERNELGNQAGARRHIAGVGVHPVGFAPVRGVVPYCDAIERGPPTRVHRHDLAALAIHDHEARRVIEPGARFVVDPEEPRLRLGLDRDFGFETRLGMVRDDAIARRERICHAEHDDRVAVGDDLLDHERSGVVARQLSVTVVTATAAREHEREGRERAPSSLHARVDGRRP